MHYMTHPAVILSSCTTFHTSLARSLQLCVVSSYLCVSRSMPLSPLRVTSHLLGAGNPGDQAVCNKKYC